MTITTECFDGARKRDSASDADAGFLVTLFDARPEEVLEEGKFCFIGGKYKDVIVGLAELRGDREFGFWNIGIGKQLLQFVFAHRRELDLAGIEFAQELTQCVLVSGGEFRELIVRGHIAQFLSA